MLAEISFAMVVQFAHEPGPISTLLHADDGPRVNLISRADGRLWPFSVDEGFLACAHVAGRPIVYFIETPSSEDQLESEMRFLALQDHRSASPVSMLGDNLITADAPKEALAEFVALGVKLCSLPENSMVMPDGSFIPADGL